MVKEHPLGRMYPPPLEARNHFLGHAEALRVQGEGARNDGKILLRVGVVASIEGS